MNEKVLNSVLSGQQDNNIKFNDLRLLLSQLGFSERIRGDHYIYVKQNIREIINIQPNGKMAKGYQVKQIRDIILKYGWGR
jgi:predicted RNA binding protein YcfA (HicA-like mRNA interferase family)